MLFTVPHQLQGRFLRNCRSGVVVKTASGATKVATVPVTFKMQKHVEYGEVVKVIGDHKTIGRWDHSKGVNLEWGEGDFWTGTTQLPVGADVHFKFITVGDGSTRWEDTENRNFKILGPDYGLTVECKKQDTKISSYKLKGAQPTETKEQQSNNRDAAKADEVPRSKDNAQKASPSSSAANSMDELKSRVSHLTAAWVGAEPEFVRSRKDNNGRNVVWNTSSLDGYALEIVQGDEKAPSWLQKLELTKELLVNHSVRSRPGPVALASCYIYSTWINNGTISCIESGGHQRPNRHANQAMEIFRSLEWTIEDAVAGKCADGMGPELTVLVARKMHTRLPSFSGEFRASTPLTRIRDIAHRNDIPKDLKDEIKHTIQNKLHRNAGPEDLIASEKMLARITENPGQYNGDFVNEFAIFVRELRQFFNASDLVELLENTRSALTDDHVANLNMFLAAKQEADGSPDPSVDLLMRLLYYTSCVRAGYVDGLRSGLRNDAPDDSLVMRQNWRLSEIRLEDLAFVLISQMINKLEAQGGAVRMSSMNNDELSKPLAAVAVACRMMGMSAINPLEMLVVEEEMKAWVESGPLTQTKDNALRMKASLDRVLRSAKRFSEQMMELYNDPARQLCAGFGVPSHMGSIFAEGEVRSHLVFQASKLLGLLSKAMRIAAKVPAVDSVVTGQAVGKLMGMKALTSGVLEGLKEDVVLVLDQADGDEEVASAGRHVKGLLLLHDIPHLSHLGVRSRQEGVVFATCEDEDVVRQWRSLLGKQVVLDVGSENVQLSDNLSRKAPASKSATATATAPSQAAPITRATQAQLVSMADCTQQVGGAKAATCAELGKLAVKSPKLFSTPAGLCLPFGVMEVVLEGAGKSQQHKELLEHLEGSQGMQLEAACEAIQKLVGELSVPPALLQQVAAGFAAGTRVVVRSSANVEDLAGMSAAGLYDSVVGVDPANAAELGKAVAAVWASLYSRRAVASRRAAGVPQGAACMAVLVQQLVVPLYSFVLHTARPSDSNPQVAVVELAVGQGETLCSGETGAPYRLSINKMDMAVATSSFANFSSALVLKEGRVLPQPVNYAAHLMSRSAEYRMSVAQRITQIGSALEAEYGCAQDVEGGILLGKNPGPNFSPGEHEVMIFQSRPQGA